MSHPDMPPAAKPVPGPPIPRPPASVPDRPHLSNLEYTFGFEEPAFQKYMLTRNTDAASSHKLMQLAVEMDTAVHPLVMYAAGWAAAEAACHRRASGGMDEAYAKRTDALDYAEACWTAAKHQFSQAERAARLPLRQADYRSFAERAELARAHLPLFEVITDWRTTDRFPACHVDEAIDETRANVISLARAVLQESTDSSYNQQYQIHYGGMRNELLGSLLLQLAVGGSGLIVPSSLRQDHNKSPNLRADLVKITTAEPHVETLVQISRPAASKSRRDVLVLRKNDLITGGLLTSSLLALTAAVDSLSGVPQPPKIEAELVTLGKKVATKLSDYEERAFQKPGTKNTPQ